MARLASSGPFEPLTYVIPTYPQGNGLVFPRASRTPGSQYGSDLGGLVSLFDPIKGRGPRILQTSDWIDGDIAPDGQRIAWIVAGKPQNRIRFSSVRGGAEAEITVSDANKLDSLDWIPDGSGFFSADHPSAMETRLFHIERNGVSEVVWAVPDDVDLWGIPSPDGAYRATFRKTVVGNDWKSVAVGTLPYCSAQQPSGVLIFFPGHHLARGDDWFAPVGMRGLGTACEQLARARVQSSRRLAPALPPGREQKPARTGRSSVIASL